MHTISSGPLLRLVRGPHAQTLYVDHGTVNCPRQGDIEFDACFACPDYKKLNHSGGLAVVCSPPTSSGFDPTPFSWFKPFDSRS